MKLKALLCLVCSFWRAFSLPLVWIQAMVYTDTHTQTHCSVPTGAKLLLWCPSCQVVLLLPGTCHRGDGWLHHQHSPEGNGTLKERNHLSILSSAFFSDDRPPLFLCPRHPPFVPFTLPFISPSPPSPFIKNPKNEREKKYDRSTVSNLAENVAHASEHKILPRPSHWPQSKSEEAYLNTPFMMVSCSGSRRKFSPSSV